MRKISGARGRGWYWPGCVHRSSSPSRVRFAEPNRLRGPSSNGARQVADGRRVLCIGTRCRGASRPHRIPLGSSGAGRHEFRHLTRGPKGVVHPLLHLHSGSSLPRREGANSVVADQSQPEQDPREECGVFGVWAPGEDVAKLTYYGLYALQHRGQEAAGISVGDGSQVVVFKDLGLVSQVFDEQVLQSLKGHVAVGHCRYSTTGSTTWENAQPTFRTTAAGRGCSLGHNGNLVNTAELLEKAKSARHRRAQRRHHRLGHPLRPARRTRRPTRASSRPRWSCCRRSRARSA